MGSVIDDFQSIFCLQVIRLGTLI